MVKQNTKAIEYTTTVITCNAINVRPLDIWPRSVVTKGKMYHVDTAVKTMKPRPATRNKTISIPPVPTVKTITSRLEMTTSPYALNIQHIVRTVTSLEEMCKTLQP